MQTTFIARFFDGKKIVPFEATVTLFLDRLEINYDSPQEKKIYWSKRDLQIMEYPFDGREAVIGYKSMQGARLIVKEPLAFQAILAMVSKKNIKRSSTHHPLLFLILCIFIILIIIFWGVPLFSAVIAKAIPYSWDEALGKWVINEITQNDRECTNPKGIAALNKLTSRFKVIPHSLNIKVVDNDNINAFAVPGFNIVLMKGLIQFADTPEAIAGVLAHEMGHIIEHHPTQGIFRHLWIKLMMSITFGTSLEFASPFLQLHYSRQAETQADKLAINLLYQANVNIKDYILFFEKLEKEHHALPHFISNYLSDHPAITDRINTIKTLIEAQTVYPILTPLEWRELKNICN